MSSVRWSEWSASIGDRNVREGTGTVGPIRFFHIWESADGRTHSVSPVIPRKGGKKDHTSWEQAKANCEETFAAFRKWINEVGEVP